MARLLVPVALALATAALLPTASARGPRPIPGGNERSIVLLWGGQLFVSRGAFEDWLNRHHEAYRRWARLHPDGRAILVQAASPLRVRRSQLAPTHSSEPRPALLAPAKSGARSVAIPLAVLAIVLIGVGLLPLDRIPKLRVLRFATSALGIAILVGVAAARLAS